MDTQLVLEASKNKKTTTKIGVLVCQLTFCRDYYRNILHDNQKLSIAILL